MSESSGTQGALEADIGLLLDPEVYRRDGPPHQLFALLRENDPVRWHPEQDGPGFWAVTRYEDVTRVSLDSVAFSSWLGGTMVTDMHEDQLAIVRLMMLNIDPPQHTKLRALVNRGFTPRRVQHLKGRVQDLAREIVDRVAPHGRCDFVEEVAGELPSHLIAELMGIPVEDGRNLYRLTEEMHRSATAERSGTAFPEMMAYAARVRTEKRAHPGDDIASALLNAEVDGRKLTDGEFDMFFMLLINAGGDTTRNLVAGGMLELIRHPEQRQRLVEDPGLLPSAIEEMLRYTSPVLHFRRTATCDSELGGRRIAAGDKVVIFYVSANRDEAVFVDPERFDITRTPNKHIAFGGGGSHFCLGANLARLEIQALFEQILTRMPGLHLAGDVERLDSTFINGIRRMPVAW